MAEFWSDYIWPLVIMVAESLLLLVIWALWCTGAWAAHRNRRS